MLKLLIIDNNVPEKILTSEISEQFEEKVSGYKRVLTPYILAEACHGLTTSGKEEYFLRDQSKIRLLGGNSGYEAITFPFNYAVKQVCGVVTDRELPIDNVRVNEWYKIAISATSLAQITRGEVPYTIAGQAKRDGIKSEVIQKVLALEKSTFQEMHHASRDEIPVPPIAEWISALASNASIKLSNDNVEKLVDAMSLSYALFSHYMKPTGKLRADGAWADYQYLMYLCDPNVFFLTGDKNIKKDCLASNYLQSNNTLGQILELDTFIR